MTDEQRNHYIKKYWHLNLYFAHGRGWDNLTLIQAISLDNKWPEWMPNWFKRLNNKLLYAYGGRSLVRTTKLYRNKLFRKLFPFIKEYPRFMQIKEKYGTLRLYGGDELESPLENLSTYICEECGSTNDVKLYTNGWFVTRCKNCYKGDVNNY